LPFRKAHEVVAKVVRMCMERHGDLGDLTLPEMQAFSPLIESDVMSVLTLEGSVSARRHLGGTAPEQVVAAISAMREDLGLRE
jgi:argininosuccinate lyase